MVVLCRSPPQDHRAGKQPLHRVIQLIVYCVVSANNLRMEEYLQPVRTPHCNLYPLSEHSPLVINLALYRTLPFGDPSFFP